MVRKRASEAGARKQRERAGGGAKSTARAPTPSALRAPARAQSRPAPGPAADFGHANKKPLYAALKQLRECEDGCCGRGDCSKGGTDCVLSGLEKGGKLKDEVIDNWLVRLYYRNLDDEKFKNKVTLACMSTKCWPMLERTQDAGANSGAMIAFEQQFLQPRLGGRPRAIHRSTRQGGWLFPQRIAGGDDTAVVNEDAGAMTLIPVHMKDHDHWGMIVVWWARNQIAWADGLNLYKEVGSHKIEVFCQFIDEIEKGADMGWMKSDVFKRCNIEFPFAQAADSNDCGVYILGLARLLANLDASADLETIGLEYIHSDGGPHNELRGTLMRRRVRAELLAADGTPVGIRLT